MRSLIVGSAITALFALAPITGRAHFLLLEPIPTLVQTQNGDPQKLGPCGGTSANPGTPTNVISRVRGGTPLHITIRETIYHPGHYRIALAVNSTSELPPDPVATTRETAKGPYSVAAPIDANVKPPVLADGLFPHTERPTQLFQADVEMPNITCRKCTLQVVEFMAEHGVNADGGFYYHHCANLAITADPAKPIDTRWPAEITQ